jgi:hypothetical protein
MPAEAEPRGNSGKGRSAAWPLRLAWLFYLAFVLFLGWLAWRDWLFSA